MDTQQLEVMGRHRLIESLIRSGLEVAMPLRDRGVDLLAYTSPGSREGFAAIPIQMKSFSVEGWSLHRKYASIDHLVLVYVWHMSEPEKSSILALTYQEALGVATGMGYAATESWKKERGGYSVTRVGERLREMLLPFDVTKRGWHEVLKVATSRRGASR